MGDKVHRASLALAPGLSSDVLAAIAEHAQEGLIILDADQRYRLWNPFVEKLTGVRAADVLGRRMLDVFPEMENTRPHDATRRALAGETVRFIDHPEPNVPIEKATFVSMVFAPLWGSDGAIHGVVTSVADVTARKRAERALAERDNRLRAILHSEPECVKLVSRTGELVDMNRAGLAMLEVETLEELLGHNVTEVIAEPYHEAYRELNTRVFEGRSGTMQFEIIGLKGTRRWVETFATPLLDAEGRIASALSITRDISERRSLEEQLRQSQKMEAIGRLAGGVAHDFNNLLTVIHGYSKLLVATCADSQRADLQEIVNAAERAAGLTRQLLAFSRRQLLQARVVDLNAVVTELTAMLQRLIGEQYEIVPELASGLGMVRADRLQIEQVLMNLVVNARDAMPSGGTVVIATDNTSVTVGGELQGVVISPGPYVRVAVRDRGEGMTEEVKARVFEPFFSTKKRTEAAGLGLSTVYGIVVQSGGHIRVDSAPGQGSAFEIWLPRIDEVAPPPERSVLDTVPATGGAVVLVAEDEMAVRRLARRILESAGFRVLEAGDPAEAEQVFAANADQIDVLLTDIVMPGGTGPELFAKLKTLKPGLRGVCMSAYAESAVMAEGNALAGAAFLQKPFSAPALVRIVQRALDM